MQMFGGVAGFALLLGVSYRTWNYLVRSRHWARAVDTRVTGALGSTSDAFMERVRWRSKDGDNGGDGPPVDPRLLHVQQVMRGLLLEIEMYGGGGDGGGDDGGEGGGRDGTGGAAARAATFQKQHTMAKDAISDARIRVNGKYVD